MTDRPTNDDIDSILDELDAKTDWSVEDYHHEGGMGETASLQVTLEWRGDHGNLTPGVIRVVKEAIDDCEGDEGAPVDRVIEQAKSNGVDDPEPVLDKLKGMGEVYEPSKGKLRRT